MKSGNSCLILYCNNHQMILILSVQSFEAVEYVDWISAPTWVNLLRQVPID